jgi:transposase
MDQAERRRAKAQLVANMAAGQSWREAAAQAGLTISRSAAYRLAQRARTEGEGALEDQRHGHPSKLSAPVQQWLVATCREAPYQSGQMLQAALEQRFGLQVSRGHLNAIRARLGLKRPRGGVGKKSSEYACR